MCDHLGGRYVGSLNVLVLDKVRLTFMKREKNADERWGTLEVKGGELDDCCRSLVVVGERKRSRKVFGHGKKLQRSSGAPQERPMSVL